MKILMLEDEFFCRLALQKLLVAYGECHIAVEGREALRAFEIALETGEPYDLVCLDILLPDTDGLLVLKGIRNAERSHHVFPEHYCKILMTTTMNDMKSIMDAYNEICDGYLVKPVTPQKLAKAFREIKLFPPETALAGARISSGEAGKA